MIRVKEWGCLFSESGFGDPTCEAHVIGGWRFTISKISLILNLLCSARFFIVLKFSVTKCTVLCFETIPGHGHKPRNLASPGVTLHA